MLQGGVLVPVNKTIGENNISIINNIWPNQELKMEWKKSSN